ncbi:MAG: hypothetical protein GPJ51_00710 [Candidatus Heimdallarchaeota archaeon]|nr:hypothetical protein [Candidatus Heimdallarchaeota archaeon]
MKRQIFLGISLLIILLPFVTPSSPMAVTDAYIDSSFPSTPELNAVASGQKLFYNISEFQYGDGIWEVLDMLLTQVGGPIFDKGLIGSLEGSEIVTYISYLNDINLYQWDDMVGGYENQTLAEAMEIFTFLQLNDDLGVYVNASQFSFPEDFTNTDLSSYFDYWPYGHFNDPIFDEFWNGFNNTFETTFEIGWNDAEFASYNNWFWYPNENNYNDNDIYWFGYDYGNYFGYEYGYGAYWESGMDPLWNDKTAALSGFYQGFIDARDDGFLQGRLDFNVSKIPDKRYSGVIPPYSSVYDYGMYREYQHYYEMWYEEGFLYEGAKVYFNRELYGDLYNDEWETFWSGYVEGYENYYWDGYWSGDADQFGSYPGPNYWPPEPWTDPYDSRESGYFDGMQVGYDAGYDDGYYGYNIGEQYLQGMWNYKYDAFFDGFDQGAADKLAMIPANNVPSTLPYSPSTTDPYEQGANFIYERQYAEGYDRGYLYAALVSSPDELNWLWSNGPFYNMNVPDFEFTLGTGSIVPTPLMDFTMLSDLNMLLPMDQDWEFNWGAHDYWPFNDMIIPMQTFYAGTTDWDVLNTFSQVQNDTEGTPGITTTYDVANDYFAIEMHLNASEPGVTQDVIWGYDTVSGMLLNVTTDVDFYSMTDVWANLTIEYDPAKTVDVTPSLPSPSSWTYLVNNFVFYFDLPIASDPDFVDGITEFKTNGLSSIGNPILGVDMVGFDGLWAEADVTMYDPANVSIPPELGSYTWPMFSPQGPMWNPNDWEMYDGLWTTVSSIVSVTPYLESALNALAIDNSNVDLTALDLNLVADQYYYAAQDIMYYYVTIDALIDFGWTALNGEYIWETITQNGWIRGSIWLGVDYTTGIVLGAGAKASFEFEVTQVPNYGMNGGILSAYIEMSIGANFKTLPDLYTLIGGLPAVNEFGIVSILSIIGLAAVASAVIFTKKR